MAHARIPLVPPLCPSPSSAVAPPNTMRRCPPCSAGTHVSVWPHLGPGSLLLSSMWNCAHNIVLPLTHYVASPFLLHPKSLIYFFQKKNNNKSASTRYFSFLCRRRQAPLLELDKRHLAYADRLIGSNTSTQHCVCCACACVCVCHDTLVDAK